MKHHSPSPHRGGGGSSGGAGSIMFKNIKSVEYWNHKEEQWDTISELAPQDSLVILLDWQNMRLFNANAKWGQVDRITPMLMWDRQEILGYHLFSPNGDAIATISPQTPAQSISFLLRNAGNLAVLGESPSNDHTMHIAETLKDNLPDNKYLHFRVQFYSQTFKIWISLLKKFKVSHMAKFDPDVEKPPPGKYKAKQSAAGSHSSHSSLHSSSSGGVLNPGLWFKDSMKSVFEYWDDNKKSWVAPSMLDCEDFRFTMKSKTVYYYVAAYNENLRTYAMSRENNDSVQCQAISWPSHDIIAYGSDEYRTTPGSLGYTIALKIKGLGIYSSFGRAADDMQQQHRARFERNCQTAQRVHELIRDELASSLDEPDATIWVRFRSSKPFPKGSTFLREEGSFECLGSNTENLPLKFPCTPQGSHDIGKKRERRGDDMENKQERSESNYGKQYNKEASKQRVDNGVKDWATAAEEEKATPGIDWQNEPVPEQQLKAQEDDGWAVPQSVPELIDWDAPIEPATTNWDTPLEEKEDSNGWETSANLAVGGGGDKGLSSWDDQPTTSSAQQDLLTGAPSGPKQMYNNNNNNRNFSNQNNNMEKKSDHFDVKRARKPRGAIERPQYSSNNSSNGHFSNAKLPPSSPNGYNKPTNGYNLKSKVLNNRKEAPRDADEHRSRGNSNYSRSDVNDRAELISIISSNAHHRSQSNDYKMQSHDWDNNYPYDDDQPNGIGNGHDHHTNNRINSSYLDELDRVVNGAVDDEKFKGISNMARDKFFGRHDTKEMVDNLQQRRKALVESLRDVDEQMALLQQKINMQNQLWNISLELSRRKKA